MLSSLPLAPWLRWPPRAAPFGLVGWDWRSKRLSSHDEGLKSWRLVEGAERVGGGRRTVAVASLVFPPAPCNWRRCLCWHSSRPGRPGTPFTDRDPPNSAPSAARLPRTNVAPSSLGVAALHPSDPSPARAFSSPLPRWNVRQMRVDGSCSLVCRA